MERGNRHIPIELKMGSHKDKNSPILNAVSQTAREFLGSSANGRVVMFKEAANVTTTFRNRVVKYVNQGLLVSESQLRTQFAMQRRVEPTVSNLEIERKARRKSPGFDVAYTYAIDRLQAEYPNRVRVDMEFASYKDIRNITRSFRKFDKVVTRIDKLVSEGRFTEALPFFQEGAFILATQIMERDPRIVVAIKEASKQTDALAVVGSLGSNHTEVVHGLRKDGFIVRASFPEAEGGLYVYAPWEAAVRHIIFFPNRPYTEEEWLKIMVGDIIFTGLMQLKYKYTHPGNILEAGYYFFKKRGLLVTESDQFLTRIVWGMLRWFTMEDISIFEETFRQRGVDQTIEAIMKK